MEFDKNFLKEEERNGYIINEKIKKVWWIQIEIVKEFARICEKNNLRWYLTGGVLIGVVRHHGFIPWDDDIDLIMPREDYNKFIDICEEELKYPYHLRTTLTEEECYQCWISICNSETTGNRSSCINKKQNNGIAVDILPFDGCEDNVLLYSIRRLPLYVVSVICNTYVNDFNQSFLARILRKVVRNFNFDYKRAYKWLEKQCTRHPWSKHNQVTHTLIADPIARDIRKVIYKKEWYNSTIEMPFENTTLPVPIGYHEILTTEYGNYMEFPSIDKRKPKHDMIFEPDIAYRDYCSKMYKNK